MSDEWSDDELLARLADVLSPADTVPPDLIATAKCIFAWHDLDPDLVDPEPTHHPEYDFRLAAPVWDTGLVEPSLDAGLAHLTFDSAAADREAALTRASAATRALTLIAAELTIELEISKDVLYGQLIPAQPGDVQLRTVTGETTMGPIDDVGHFVLRGISAEPFRLHCRTHSGPGVSTTWICP